MPQLDPFALAKFAGLPSKLAEAIAAADLPSLGEGSTAMQLTELLNDVEISESGLVFANGENAVLSGSQAALAFSGLWLLAGDLEKSHSISQDMPCRDGSFWHGIMHRREGDFGNSKYWFRKVGNHPVFEQLPKLSNGIYTDPFDFADQCSRALSDSTSEAHQSCLLGQWLEWQALMVHCLGQ